jgi:hypothetical protein
MHIPELIGYPLVVLARVVNNDGQQEGLVGCDQVRPVNRELPFEAEVPLDAIVRVPRDDRDEQGTCLDLLADRRSQTSPPRSVLWSNQTSMLAARRASQIRWAASWSCEA